jgi:hypothetical protein
MPHSSISGAPLRSCQQHDGAASQERPVDRDVAVHVRRGQRCDDDVGRGPPVHGRGQRAVEQDGLLGLHGTLGVPGGPRGVADRAQRPRLRRPQASVRIGVRVGVEQRGEAVFAVAVQPEDEPDLGQRPGEFAQLLWLPSS